MHVLCLIYFFFFKQKTAYEMRISDCSSDVCSSDLRRWWWVALPPVRLPVRQPCYSPHVGLIYPARNLTRMPKEFGFRKGKKGQTRLPPFHPYGCSASLISDTAAVLTSLARYHLSFFVFFLQLFLSFLFHLLLL